MKVDADLERCVGLFHERVCIPECPDFPATNISREQVIDFLRRVLQSHPELSAKKTPGLVSDRLLMYSIIMRKTPIFTSTTPYNPIQLTKESELKQLRARSGTDPLMWPDGRLCCLNNRLNSYQRRNSPFHITYRGLVDETGAWPDAIALWGFQIVYDKHVGKAAGDLPTDRNLAKNRPDYAGHFLRQLESL